MSFDIQQMHISDNSPEAQVIEAIISRDHVSPEEAIRRALRGVATEQGYSELQSPVDTRGTQHIVPITDEELARLDALCPALKLLGDVSDETWEQIANGARQMNEEGFANRG